MKKNKNRVVVGLIIVMAILIVVTIFLLNKNKLNPEDKLVKNLYGLIEQSLDNCNGMILYQNKKIDYVNLSDNERMCLALNLVSTNENVELSIKKNKDYCEFAKDKLFLITDEENKKCNVKKVDYLAIKNEYEKLYNKPLENTQDIKVSGETNCFYNKNDNSYLCGTANQRNIIIGWEPTSYRLIDKVVKKGSDIVIYDYFVLINSNICYIDNNETENKDCSKILESKPKTKINNTFVKKYGQKYKHTFKLNEESNSYYWESSSPIK